MTAMRNAAAYSLTAIAVLLVFLALLSFSRREDTGLGPLPDEATQGPAQDRTLEQIPLSLIPKEEKKGSDGSAAHPLNQAAEPAVPCMPGATPATPVPTPDGKATGSIEGRILEFDGRSRVEIEVTAEREGGGNGSKVGVRTDSRGVFCIEDLAPGIYQVYPGKDQSEPEWPQKDVRVRAGRVSRADFGGPEWVRVRGGVRDHLGKPVAFASIKLKKQGEAFLFTHFNLDSDQEGSFTIACMEPGLWEWTVINKSSVEIRVGQKGIPKVPEYVWDLELTMPTGQTVDILVVDAKTGLPVEAFLILSPRMAGSDFLLRSDRTDNNGQVRFEGLAPGTWQVTAMASGYLNQTEEIDAGRNPDGRFRIILSPDARVRVCFKLASGRPVETRWVQCEFAPIEKVKGPQSWKLKLSKTEEESILDARGLCPGRTSLSVQGSGFKPVKREVVLEEGDNPPIEVVLEEE